MEIAKLQHENFVQILRNLGLDVIELPPDESQPEAVYIEDCAVIVNGICLLTRPANNRLAEVSLFYRYLKFH